MHNANTIPYMKTRMIARRVSKGFNRAGSETMLEELLESHVRSNLEMALVYEQFATENQAYCFVESLNK